MAENPENPQKPIETDVPHVMVIESRFYEDIADELAKGALGELDDAGVTYERFAVPGTFEIPAAVRIAIKSREFNPVRRRFDGYVALGCVIRGDTSHYDYVCSESARGLQNLALEFVLAIGYGILTCENRKQAEERASVSKLNKGGVAARTCLEMIEFKRFFRLFPRR
ncbi:MAG: 6,7-dimethyl-8-ribityllumazine synthase [Alphaproteobacteria bacterium]|nr:6,7-dimethyl-8-ribityllumazine synthase [Alphaproteobacteria bacterium]